MNVCRPSPCLCRANRVPNRECCPAARRHGRPVDFGHPCRCHPFVFDRLLVPALTEYIAYVLPSKGLDLRLFIRLFIIRLYRLHLLQFSMNMFPCSSDTNFRATPDFKCNPSMFWLTMYLTWPASINAFNAICVLVGAASSKEILIVGFSPFSSSVHTPFGPLHAHSKWWQKLMFFFSSLQCGRAINKPKIWNASRCADAGTGMHHNMFGRQN